MDKSVESLSGELHKKIDNLPIELWESISSVRTDLSASIDSIRGMTTTHNTRLSDLEQGTNTYSDRIVELERKVMTLTSEVDKLQDKINDLESRQRRDNCRIFGVEECFGSIRPEQSIAQLLRDSLKLDYTPTLDRAHRSLQQKPKSGDPPRPIVVKFHYLQEKVEPVPAPSCTMEREYTYTRTTRRKSPNNVLPSKRWGACYTSVRT